MLSKYIELNPVRAGMVADPADYRWSSYRANAHGLRNPLITPHALYCALDENDRAKQAAYRSLFDIALDNSCVDEIRLALNQNQPLGNNRFSDQIEAVTGARREVRPRGRPRREPAL